MAETPFIVALTGFEPWAEFTVNTSALVRDAIPTRIDRPGKRPISIIKYPRDIPVNYTSIRALVPQLWSGQRAVYDPAAGPADAPLHIDLMLHLGMRTRLDAYCLERRARKVGYEKAGEDGRFFPRAELLGAGGAWERLPDELTPVYDLDVVQKKVAGELPGVETMVSDDAGLFFCEFIFYSSLAELQRLGRPATVEFLHVPKAAGEEEIKRGAKVAVALISALADASEE